MKRDEFLKALGLLPLLAVMPAPATKRGWGPQTDFGTIVAREEVVWKVCHPDEPARLLRRRHIQPLWERGAVTREEMEEYVRAPWMERTVLRIHGA